MAMASFKLVTLIPNGILRWMGAGVQSFGDQHDDALGEAHDGAHDVLDHDDGDVVLRAEARDLGLRGEVEDAHGAVAQVQVDQVQSLVLKRS